ncbi:hypothetical protein BHE74_00009189 [Ensete ventricosum]|nr:hypothetical protein BHE74_00009189 [Ensete ventricosum]
MVDPTHCGSTLRRDLESVRSHRNQSEHISGNIRSSPPLPLRTHHLQPLPCVLRSPSPDRVTNSGRKMSLALSSFSPSSVLLPARRGPINRRRWHITAMGAQSRDDLDHLQRASKPQQSQPLLKRRAAPSSPIAVPSGLWDRFPTARTIQQMMDTMERVMEDPFAYGGASLPSLSGEDSVGSYRRGRTPWEIKEGEGEYRMRFDMPGMTKKDVKVWVEERMLVIEAKKLPAKEGEEEDWAATSYGRYSSRIALPDNVLVEQIKAEVKDGVLYITIPKASTSTKVLDVDVQ